MDAALGKFSSPCGKDTAEGDADVIEGMLMLGVQSEIAANEETVEASAKYIFGDEDDEEEYDEMNDDKIGMNETFDSI